MNAKLWVPDTPEETLEKEKEKARNKALCESFYFKLFIEGFKIGKHESKHGSTLLPEETRVRGYFLEFMKDKE